VIDGGSVVVQHGDSQKQVAGAINAPLLPGDFITTGPGARAEVQFDGFTMLRLSQNVQARIVASDVKTHRLQVAAGTVELAVLHSGGATTTVETPSITVDATATGDIRISVDADGSTSITARTGSASLKTPQHTSAMEAGTTYLASGSASKPVVTQIKEIGYDAFDDFNARRDKTIYAALNADTDLPQSIAGYDNLNSYGKWVDVQPYGQVWIPNDVASDWAPYRDGQWTWTSAYGWTWVSNEPWGWAPYHYGRWFYQTGYGWCWLPPSTDSVPAWEPALVGFFGYGSFSSGDFGWVPLAPYENYFPSYGYNQVYNPGWPGWYIPVVTPVQPRPTPRPRTPSPVRSPFPIRKPPTRPPFRNAARGASGVDAQSFRAGDFSHVRPVDMTRVENLSVVRGAPPFAPSPQNYGFTHAPVRTPVPISHVFSQPRFTAPITQTQSPSVWNHVDPVRGAVTPRSAPPVINGSPVRSQPVNSTPVNSQPVHSAPVNSQPVHSAPSHPVSDPPHTSGSRPPHR